MAIPVLIMGKSGSGKSASLRNTEGKWLVINVNNKPLPFKNKDNINLFNCDDYQKIKLTLSKCAENGYKSVVLDDAGYLLTGKFMAGHRGKSGNSQFDLYNEIADNYYSLIKFITDDLPNDVIVYVVMHEASNDFGEVKPKTIGRLLDEKVCVEGMFTIVLRAVKVDGKYLFATTTTGLDVTKSPMGMFETEYVDNDIQYVDNTIREYYK